MVVDNRLLFADLKTGVLIGELPVSSFSYSMVYNDAGSISGVFPLRPYGNGVNAHKRNILTRNNFSQGRTCVYVVRNDVPITGGILWTTDYTISDDRVVFDCSGPLSYFRRRYVRDLLTYSSTDQTTIFKNLIDYAQTGDGDIGVDTSTVTATGVNRDRTYLEFERKNIGDALEELAAVQNGFRFEFEPIISSGVASWRLLTSYPDTGRETNHIFEFGSNCDLVQFREDGTNLANRVDALGRSQGDSTTVSSAQNTSVLTSYPLLEDVEQFTDISRSSTLQDKADLRLIRGLESKQFLTIRLYTGATPSIGEIKVSDFARVRGSRGMLDVDDQFRITDIGVRGEDSGLEQVEVTLVTRGLFE